MTVRAFTTKAASDDALAERVLIADEGRNDRVNNYCLRKDV